MHLFRDPTEAEFRAKRLREAKQLAAHYRNEYLRLKDIAERARLESTAAAGMAAMYAARVNGIEMEPLM